MIRVNIKMPLPDLVSRQASRNGDKVAAYFSKASFVKKEITFSELDKLSNQLANLLVEKGVKQGSFVGI